MSSFADPFESAPAGVSGEPAGDGEAFRGPEVDRGPGAAGAEPAGPAEAEAVEAPPGAEAPAGAGAPPEAAPGATGDGGSADDLADVEAAVELDMLALQQERDDYLDALRRLQADFENYKKRTLKQQTEHLERAAQALVEKLLPVLDAADLAIAHGAGEAVAQVFGLLMDTLAKEGLEGVDPKPGDPFDPTVHEAVAHEPGDGEAQEIADVLRAGYRWKGALLRPAMVKVRG